MACVTNKKMYLTEALAEDALIEAHTQFDFRAGTGPIAVYRCEDCGQYHLTSKGEMNKKLSASIAEGKINLQKEANHWLDKFKHK